MISLMLPYSLSFMAAGFVLLMLWSGLDLPVGPGAPATYDPPAGMLVQ